MRNDLLKKGTPEKNAGAEGNKRQFKPNGSQAKQKSRNRDTLKNLRNNVRNDLLKKSTPEKNAGAEGKAEMGTPLKI